jgi:putative drug exporter of the RND superfamily
MIARLARFCYNKRRVVLLAWILALASSGALQGVLGLDYKTEFRQPNSESATGFKIVEDNFPKFGGGGAFGGQLVFRTDKGVNDPSVKAEMEKLFAHAAKLKGLTVTSPYSPEGAGQIAQAGEYANKLAFARVAVDPTLTQQDFLKYAKDLRAARPKLDGGEVLLGGQVFAEFKPPETELIGLAFAVVILILAFGSVLAMGLPIATALVGIFAGTGLLAIATQFLSVPDFTPFVGIMIGLGVGIDYALFIITRYRDALRDGLGYEEATVEAMDTAGRAVLFAGITVVISVLGMWVMGLKFIQGLAVGASVTVLTVLAASMTLLPAMLGFSQHRINVTRRRGVIAAAGVSLAFLGLGIKIPALAAVGGIIFLAGVLLSFVIPALRKEVPHRPEKPLRETIWYRWSRVVQHRPWAMAFIGMAILLLMAFPVLSLRLGFSDDGNFPEKTETRESYDLIAKGFGAGFSAPFIVVAELPTIDGLAQIDELQTRISKDPNVAFASPATPSPNGKAAIIQIIAKTAPQDVATDDLVKRIRAETIPGLLKDSPIKAYVAGTTAANLDFSAFLGRRTPLFFAAVLGLSFLLLMVVFRSLLVPLKAVIMNLLSIGAAYGVLVAIFQWGWGKELVGVGKGGPIEPFLPMMLFAIVFGLSMDYEVFLLSRMKEEFDRTGDNANAVADGVAMTARVITAAAAIMVVVFGAFVLEDTRTVKMFGIGLAVAVFIDATVVRMLLVPATMELLGAKNWWMPRWLDKILPNVNVEGSHHTVPVGQTEHQPDQQPEGRPASQPVGAATGFPQN